MPELLTLPAWLRRAGALLACCALAVLSGCRGDRPDGVGAPAGAADLEAIVRRVHFAFHADRGAPGAFRGGHRTYAVRATASEVQVTPHQGEDQGEPFTLRTEAIERGGASLIEGAPAVAVEGDGTLRVQRGRAVERLENTEEGVEQSFVFAEQPAGRGDLTVRLGVSGEAFVGRTEQGLHFADAATGLGVRYGVATWVDAKGARSPVRASWEDGSIRLRVPSEVLAASAYPAVLDPTVGPEVGMDNPVQSPAPGAQTWEAIAYGNGSYLVAWMDNRYDSYTYAPYRIFAARVSTAGALLDPGGIPITLGPATATYPRIAFDGTNWLVVWIDYRASIYGDIYGARVSQAGAVLDPSGIAIAAGDHKSAPSVAFDGTSYLVAYNDNGDLYAQVVTPSGSLSGTRMLVSVGKKPVSTAVAWNGSRYLLAWNAGPSSGMLYARRVRSSGVIDTADILIASAAYEGGGQIGLAADPSGNWLLGWTDPVFGVVYAARFASSGYVIDAPPLTLTPRYDALAGSTVSVAYGGGAYALTWGGDTTADIRGVRLSPSGAVVTPVAQLINEAGARYSPALAYDGTNFYLAFADERYASTTNLSDAMGTRLNATTLAKLSTPSTLLSTAPNGQTNAAVAFNGTNYLVAWQDTRAGSSYDIYGTRLGPTGAVLDPSGLLLSQATGDQTAPAVASNGSGWFVVWQDERGGIIKDDIYGTRVSATGSVLDPAGLLVSAGSASGGQQTVPAVASNGSGYLALWFSEAFGNDSVVGARVSSAGVVQDPNGFDVSVGPWPSLSGARPALAWNGTSYLAVWGQSNTGYDLRAARISAGGAVLDSPSLALRTGYTYEVRPAVASDGTNWLVAWSESTMRGARVAPDGTLLGAFDIGAGGLMPSVTWDSTQYWVTWAKDFPRSILTARVSGAGAVTDTTPITIASEPTGTHTLSMSPARAASAGPAKNLLVAYDRFDSALSNGATRVRARIVNDLGTPGAVCSGGVQCASGSCVDGVCCDTACAGLCSACTAAKKGTGADGTCGPIAVATDPDSECAAQAPSTCGTNGSCDGNGACQRYPAATVCGPSTCSGNLLSPALCDGSGTCATSPTGTDCSPYVCSAGACKTSCTTGADCASGFACLGGVCKALEPAGAGCAAGAECASGFCVDAVCCDAACAGLCSACTAAKKGTGADGACGPIAVDTDPDAECAAQAQSTCGQTGTCDGAGACQRWASGTPCGSSSCQGTLVAAQLCDGAGACQLAATGTDCTPYACVSGACKGPCSAQADCASGFICASGACQSPLANGGACTAGSQCQSGLCVDGVCCNAACTGACQACTTAKKGAGTDGTCGPIAIHTDPDDECSAQPASSCGQSGSCDGAGACQRHPAGTACGATICQGSVVKGQICDGNGACTSSAAGTDCSPYICSVGACKNPCASSIECQSGHFCAGGVCKPLGVPGTPCAAASECASGFCVDAVCCDAACTAACNACSALAKGQGADGTCGVIKAGLDPHDECSVQAPSTCQRSGLCDGQGACGLHAAGTVCAPAACAGASATTASTCDGLGTCSPGTTKACDEGYACLNGACTTSCDDATACAPGYTCDTSFHGCAAIPVDAGTDSGAGGTGGTGGSTTTSSTSSAGGGGHTGGTGGSTGSSTGSAGGGHTGGSGGAGGHTGSTGGSSSSSSGGTSEPKGCSCRTAGGPDDARHLGAAAFALAALASRRRRRRG